MLIEYSVGTKVSNKFKMLLWWNRQTRLTQNQVSKDVSVQVRLGAPLEENYNLSFTLRHGISSVVNSTN